MKNRYTLVGPVKGGSQFWQINDTEEMFALVSISVSLPSARKEAEFLYRSLMAQEKHERDKVWKALTEEQTEGADRMLEDRTPFPDATKPTPGSPEEAMTTESALKRMQEQDDRLRVNSICSECGAKALYFQEGKKYCKAHIHIGQEIRRKKYTPQAPGKRERK